MENTFLPLIFRMRYISRWSLMFNTEKEDLMQHTAECAFLTHFLATVGNTVFHKNFDADKLAVYALYHDASEVLTGDLPTPVKYYNDEMKSIYKQIEKTAADKLKQHLPESLRSVYAPYLDGTALSAGEKQLLKCADKLCAYIKCIYEDAEGWVLRSSIRFLTPQEGPAEFAYIAYKGNPRSRQTVKVRQKASGSSRVLDEFPCGQRVVVIERGDKWTEIEVENLRCFILNEFLTTLTPEEAAELPIRGIGAKTRYTE